MSNNKISGSPSLSSLMANTFVLVSRGKSAFIKDGTGPEYGTPAQKLDTPRSMMLEPQSRLYLGEGNGYIATQYVMGAPTHYVNDYYEDQSGELVIEKVTPESAKKKNYILKPGLKTLNYDLKEEYKNSINRGICFTFGRLDVREYGDDPVLLRFIQEHEQNEDAPRAAKNRDPKRLKLFQFKPYIPEQSAALSPSVKDFDKDFEAMELVKSTRTKVGSTYTYNELKLDAILYCLQDGGKLAQGDVNQKFDLVSTWARKDGESLVDIYNQETNDVKINLQLAEQFKVIKIGAKDVRFVDGGGNTIFDFDEALTKDEIIEALTLHLIGAPIGRPDYSEIVRKIEVAKAAFMKGN